MPSTRMRIAMLHVDLPPVGLGGVAYQVHLLADAMTRLGHDVDVLTTHGVVENRPYRVLVVNGSDKRPRGKPFGAALAYRNTDLSGYDVVHAHGDDWALRTGAAPVVRTLYGSAIMEARYATSWRRRISQTVYYGMEWVSALRANEVVAISRNTSRCQPLARTVVPCAFDPTVFFPDGQRTRHPSLLAVAGLLGGRKRGSMLLSSFQRVREQLPSAELLIITRDRAEAPGVRCLANVSPAELGNLFRRSWALCSASSYEGFGVPYLEALASGVPVVTTKNVGADEVLERGRLGVICEPRDLPDATMRLLKDEPLRRSLAAQGTAAVAGCSALEVAKQYETIFRSLV